MGNSKTAITLNVDGMTCTNCALSVARTIEKKGGEEVDVNFITGEAHFLIPDGDIGTLINDIKNLGYNAGFPAKKRAEEKSQSSISQVEKKFYFTLVFTIPLFSHMLLPFAGILHDPNFQLLLCLPVFIVGIMHFGKSALKSLSTGIPNMDVLVATGFTAAFFYSLAGSIIYFGTPDAHKYLFYETSATIITLVLLGNVLEQRSVKHTTTAIAELSEIQAKKARKIIINKGEEVVVEVDYINLKKGDIVLVNSGDKIPADGIIIKGYATIDESMISGEGLPVEKKDGDPVIGGTLSTTGSLRIKITEVGEDTVLSKIIEMVKKAQQNKPAIQRLGDRVSAIFVPSVMIIALSTFFISHFVFDISMQKALMSSVAVLVISCPCAMGLATPTAIMAGIGRAAKSGILIKGGSTIEDFAKIKNIVFDKTGTLTTGKFKIKSVNCYNGTDLKLVKDVLYNLELHSSHPIAKSIQLQLKNDASHIELNNLEEVKGLGVKGTDKDGNIYEAGSFRIAEKQTVEDFHSIYLLKNKDLIAAIDVEDEIKYHAAETIISLTKQGIKTVLLSGDSEEKCRNMANTIHIETVYSEKLPDQKMDVISELNKRGPTCMVGDGINDAPALALASVGISLGNATQAAIQSSQIVLLRGDDLLIINHTLQISKHTYLTIKQNLFWAFFYNVIAIPIAAMGLLNPMVGALAMAFSDVIVIGNSIRLKSKKINYFGKRII